jgi:hypothetical protein
MTKQTKDLRRVRCSWEGCWRSTTRHPFLDDWAYLASWGPAAKDGYYGRAHADALDAVHLEDLERGIDSFAGGRAR